MIAIQLPLGGELWHWDWDGTDETIADPHPPAWRADVGEWLAQYNIKQTIDYGDDAEDGDSQALVTFESQADLEAFEARWCK